MKTLVESLFDQDLAKKDPTINGITIYKPDWKLAEKMFEILRRDRFEGEDKVELGDLEDEYKVVYCEKDCVLCECIEEKDIYVLSPETIYMNYEAAEVLYGDTIFSLTDYDVNDFDVCFDWVKGLKWINLGGGYRYPQIQKLKDAGFEEITGYIPITISNKAKDIIKKYISKFS